VLLYGTLLVLEVDLREFDLPRINRLLNGKVRNVWLGGLWALGLVLFLRDARNVWSIFLRWLPTRACSLLLMAGALWFAGALFDKLKPFSNQDTDLMAEELVETNAALLMLVFAVWANCSAAKPPW